MLSFNKSKMPIASIMDEEGDEDIIYLHEDIDGDKEPEFETTEKNKEKMFDRIISRNKKLGENQLDCLRRAFKTGDKPECPKLQRVFSDVMKEYNKALKTHMYIPASEGLSITPVIKEPSYRMFVSGLSGSGKSYYISKFLKKNKPKGEIFLFSPVQEDTAFKNVKNLRQIDIPTLLEESGQAVADVNCFPDGSVIIFDDIESYPKGVIKDYLELRNIILERGRGHKQGELGLSCICVSHNAMAGNLTKHAIRECQYWVLFPKFNARDCKTILKTYGGCEGDEIEKIMSLKGRGLLYKKSVPRYVVAEHDIIAL